MARLRAPGIAAVSRLDVLAADPLQRVRLLFLAFSVLNALPVVPTTLLNVQAPPMVRAVAVAAVFVLSGTWVLVFLGRNFSPVLGVIQLAAVVAVFAASRETEDTTGLMIAAVTFSAIYGGSRGAGARIAGLVAVQIGPVVVDPGRLPTTVFVTVSFVVVGVVVRLLGAFVWRYQSSAAREGILAATGLALVAAADMPEIVRSAGEAAYALCAALPEVRVSVALADPGDGANQPQSGPAAADAPGAATAAEGDAAAIESGAPHRGDALPRSLRVVCVAGAHADEIDRRVLSLASIFADGRLPAKQQLYEVTESQAALLAADGVRALAGFALVTPLTINETPRGMLAIESTERLPEDLAAAMHALGTQVSLALSRSVLQKDYIARENAARFEALVQNASDVITLITQDGVIWYQSPSSRLVLGHHPDDLTGSSFLSQVHPDDVADATAALECVVRDLDDQHMLECRIRHADGSWRYTETRISNLLDVPEVGGLVLNTRDVTERHALEAELRHQAFHDSLTGLANRALFVDRVHQAVTHARRDGSTVAVLFVDLDGFKRLNDSLGYSAGDAALIAVAERLRSSVRAPDTVGRLGGDEFGLLLDRLSSPADATVAAERIMASLRQPLPLPGASVELQPFLGIAISVAGDSGAEDLLRNAAVAMHRGKNYDGSYTIFDPEMHALAIRRLALESELRTAIDEGQLLLHYQPTIELKTGRVTGVEALVRWQHPRRGLVPPMEFIPLAEETGLIVPLGRWTIREACRQVRTWQQELPAKEPICLNVNLSARQLSHPEIVRDIADALDDSGLLPTRLVLEITESVLMIDIAATLNKLFQLKSLGVRLAIDDFGTGYSSFAYLRRFPIDILKIDKSFVDGVATEPTASALVDAMIRIGKTLRMETVAEGVERQEQAEQLLALDCDIAQGYLYSRPLGRDAITSLLRERSGRQSRASAA